MIQIKFFVFRICNKSLWQRNEPMAKERAYGKGTSLWQRNEPMAKERAYGKGTSRAKPA
jgi:hypothetical protein